MRTPARPPAHHTARPLHADRRRPLAGETIVFKDCVSTETLHKLLSGHPQAAPADNTAKR